MEVLIMSKKKMTAEKVRVVNNFLNDVSNVGLGNFTSSYAADSDAALFNYLGAEGLISNAWTYLALRFIKDSLYRRVCMQRPTVGLLGKYKFRSKQKGFKSRGKDFHKRLEKDGIYINAKDSVVKARNFGGGAFFIMGRKSSLPLSEKYELINDKLEIKTTSLHRWQLLGNIITDSKLRLQNTDEWVDSSRLIVFRNEVSDFPYDRYTMGWGTSIAEHTLDSINKYYKAINKPLEYLDDAKMEVYRISEMADEIADNGEAGKELIRERIKLIVDSKRTRRFAVLDKEDEVEFKSYSFGGLSDLIDKMFEVLMMELGETRTSLLGEQTTGLSNSDSAMDSYYMNIDKWRQQYKSQYYQIFEIMYQNYYGEKLPDDFEFEFPDLTPIKEKKITPDVIIKAVQAEIYDKSEAKEILEEMREDEKE